MTNSSHYASITNFKTGHHDEIIDNHNNNTHIYEHSDINNHETSSVYPHNQTINFVEKFTSSSSTGTSEIAKKRWSLLAQAVRHGLTKQNQENSIVKQVTRTKCDDDISCLYSPAGLCTWTKLNTSQINYNISTLPLEHMTVYTGPSKGILSSTSSSLGTPSSDYDDDNSEKSIIESTNSISSDLSIGFQKQVGLGYQHNQSENNSSTDTCIWFECRYPKIPDLVLKICHRIKELTFVDLVETFDNTGNVKIWPSEEALAYYAVIDKQLFNGKTICELGAGMAGLASLAIACVTNAQSIYITDGNERCVANIELCIEENAANFRSGNNVFARQLRWSNKSDYNDLIGKIDLIICSDCLYLDKSRSQLVETIAHLLVKDGEVIIIAPSRGSSLDRFITIAGSSGFKVQKVYDYIDELYETHQRLLKSNLGHPARIDNIEDKYPIMIRLKK